MSKLLCKVSRINCRIMCRKIAENVYADGCAEQNTRGIEEKHHMFGKAQDKGQHDSKPPFKEQCMITSTPLFGLMSTEADAAKYLVYPSLRSFVLEQHEIPSPNR